ncbi:MAG: hypothetical protein EOO17_03235 [Chloroflexi bacterium]|nr:MAG: hypothetical protein EOO17_03235 [Chloroflexota bacterium]
MKVSLSGLSKSSEVLSIDLPKRVEWQDITALLNIDGAEYYYVGGSSVSVRYSKAVELPDFAAQCLRVVMQHFNVSVEELSIGIHDYLVEKDLIPELANDIWSRTMSAPAPESLSTEKVEARGTGPAYWLR